MIILLSDDEREAAWVEREKQHLEDETRELRSQLAKSATAIADYGQLRQELDRSEKQRTQLSDHIQVMP